MPLIRVVYKAEEYDFDYVAGCHLDTLIAQDEISHFYRPSEGKWINIKLDPIRGGGGGYQGPERRGKDKKPKPAKEKGFLNAGVNSSDWLEGLWRLVEGNNALG